MLDYLGKVNKLLQKNNKKERYVQHLEHPTNRYQDVTAG
jgi:hypothetical protein